MRLEGGAGGEMRTLRTGTFTSAGGTALRRCAAHAAALPTGRNYGALPQARRRADLLSRRAPPAARKGTRTHDRDRKDTHP